MTLELLQVANVNYKVQRTKKFDPQNSCVKLARKISLTTNSAYCENLERYMVDYL